MKRCICLLLVVLILIGSLPTVFAAELPDTDEPTTENTSSEIAEEEINNMSTADSEPMGLSDLDSEAVSDASAFTPEEPEETVTPNDVSIEVDETVETSEDLYDDDMSIMDGLNMADVPMLLSMSGTDNGILLFNFTDNGNYTTVLNSQVAVTYRPNGTGSAKTAYIKNMGWHFARYNNTPYADSPVYCIEPYRDFGASTSGNRVDRDVTLTGSGTTQGSNVWYALPEARREAIGLVLLYSDQLWNHSISVFSTSYANNPNVPLRIATQMLIYEIVCGMREDWTFNRLSTNESGSDGAAFYNAGNASVAGFASNYNSLVSCVQNAMKIPSFTSEYSFGAPTISMTGDSTTVTDTNGVLSNWTFSDSNGVSFRKNGNQLTITKTGSISPSTVMTATRSIPSAASTTYNLWYMTGSSYQTTISLYRAGYGTAYAYFRLDPPSDPTGSLAIKKTTEDGKNLSGWQFTLYTDAACTSKYSGPHTSDAYGNLTISNLKAGTYFVKETGNADASINAQYYCASTNPQQVTITSGSTATVTFTNSLNGGGLKLTKTTEDGKNLGGWQFVLYTDAACTSKYSGPHTTDASGALTISDLNAGIYYVKETGNTDASINAQYYCASTNPQQVTITSGSTATVTFTNRLSDGGLKLVKTTEDGKNLGGWQFVLYTDAACTSKYSGPHTTDASGNLAISDLKAGTYYVKETGNTDANVDVQYYCASTNPQQVTITSGSTATVTFTNKLNNGGLKLIKTTEDGKNLGGWQFVLYTDAACTSKYSGPHTTDASGNLVISDLKTGIYFVKETGNEDASINAMYYCASMNPQKVMITAGDTATLTFTNNLTTGGVKLIKTTNTGENLSGWRIGLYTDAECTMPIPGSPFTTGEDGTVTVENLPAGTYYAMEFATEDTYWECDPSVKTVQVIENATTTVSFANTHYGSLMIRKSTNTGNHLEGWVFCVANPDGDKIGEYTTDTNGLIQIDNLLPGRYKVWEKAIEDEYWSVELGFHTPIVDAGRTAEDKWENTELGKGIFRKMTNTGGSLEGWKLTLFADEACTQEIYTYVTNAEGSTSAYLKPGIYWVKETGDFDNRFEDDFWAIDTRVQRLEIKPHEDSEVVFENVHSGRISIVKTMATDGNLDGWQFSIKDSTGAEIEGSPFTSGTDGIILTGNIAPGTYTVQELIPENSLYYCKTDNPVTVTVTAGETAEVSFTNALKPAKIWIEKVDNTGAHLKDATFRLEWSADNGQTWANVFYSDKEDVVKGGCSNREIQNGCLVSNTKGELEWDNLYPGLRYRVTEEKAPDGYTKLKGAAFDNTITADDLEITIRVINNHNFMLPKTGSTSLRIVSLCGAVAMAASLLVIANNLRKKKR